MRVLVEKELNSVGVELQGEGFEEEDVVRMISSSEKSKRWVTIELT